jgi:hypothetical protein
MADVSKEFSEVKNYSPEWTFSSWSIHIFNTNKAGFFSFLKNNQCPLEAG